MPDALREQLENWWLRIRDTYNRQAGLDVSSGAQADRLATVDTGKLYAIEQEIRALLARVELPREAAPTPEPVKQLIDMVSATMRNVPCDDPEDGQTCSERSVPECYVCKTQRLLRAAAALLASTPAPREDESPILAFQTWAEKRRVALRGPMTQTEYFLAQEAFYAAHPGKGPTSTCMAAGELSAWQPIETLPRERDANVLAWHWEWGMWIQPPETQPNATHWMPLPAAPVPVPPPAPER